VAVENSETRRVRKDGTVFPISLSVAPVRDEDGAVVGATAVHRDVTEQARAIQAAQRLAAIVESSDDAIIGKTLDGIITSWNAAAARMYGYSDQEIVGKPIELLIPKDRTEEIMDILAKVKAGQRVEHFETKRVRRDGTVFPVSLTVSPIRAPDGAIVGASTIARDVTELRQAVARAQDLIEAAPDALVGVDQAGVIQFVNRQTELSFGYDRDELVGQLVETLVPESFRAVHPEHRSSYGADPVSRPMGAGLELTGLRRDGTRFPVDISLSAIQTHDGLLVTTAVRDVTEQRRAFEAAQRLAAIVESTDDAIIGTTLEGIVTGWNEAAERMLGYSSEEIIGKSASLLNEPDRAEARPAALARIAAGQHVDRFETMLTRKDGTRFPASCTLSGIRGVDGRVVGASTIARDLTEQVQKERALGGPRARHPDLAGHRTSRQHGSGRAGLLRRDRRRDG
jgi:PAS domain S-box-containing protein